MSGRINVILGCMFSGKTTELLRRKTRYELGGKKCIVIKYKGDTRYGSTDVETHSGIKTPATSCNMLCEVDDLVKGYDVVCVDEIQFYEDGDVMCDKWANRGQCVEVSGLNGTFDRKEFPIISKLIPLAESIIKLSAICIETGNDADFSKRTSDSKELVVIGGSDVYKAVDRESYFD